MFVPQTMSARASTYVGKASLPFFFMMVAALALITTFPEIVTWLADVLFAKQKQRSDTLSAERWT